jgi:hypothetical protein
MRDRGVGVLRRGEIVVVGIMLGRMWRWERKMVRRKRRRMKRLSRRRRRRAVREVVRDRDEREEREIRAGGRAGSQR